ncbi:MAG: dipeptidase PepE [Bacteroidota bacterium]
MRLLLISNSTNSGEPFLDYPKQNIREFLGRDVKNIIFIPYAAVSFSYDSFVDKVNERFSEIGYEVKGIHSFDNKQQALERADAIITGGGNTFHLAKMIQELGLIDTIRRRVLSGTPYIGWSAGSNIACPTICTTNDMPIIQPESFKVLNLIPFQINPHYLDANPQGHAGETREQRIEEFLRVNRNIYVAGLREGTMLLIENESMRLIGPRPCRIFKYGEIPHELNSSDDFSFLLERMI